MSGMGWYLECNDDGTGMWYSGTNLHGDKICTINGMVSLAVLRSVMEWEMGPVRG